MQLPNVFTGAGNRPLFQYGVREQRIVPKLLQDRLTRVGGLNIYGEPLLRLLWGWTPTEFGWNLKDKCYELRPQYANRNRWYVEQWFPPGFYGTPDSWRWSWTQNVDGKEIDLLGPYPDRGRYECLTMVQRPHRKGCPGEDDFCACGGGFVEFTPDVADELCHRLRKSREMNPWDKRAEVIEKIENDWTRNDSELDAIIDDVMPAFGGREFVNVPGRGNGAYNPRARRVM